MSNTYRIREFAARVGCSASTIRRWEREGKITPKRHPSGQRYFDESDVRLAQGRAPDARSTVVYCRVSSAGQKDDLQSQVKAMEMVEDLLAIVHTFSCRLYGMRKYKKVEQP